MTKSPLFSTYRQGENRVTSSMLAVFERIDLSLLETLLAGAAGEAAGDPDGELRQSAGRYGASVPDARISASFAYWFEVKAVRTRCARISLSSTLRTSPGSTATSACLSLRLTRLD